MPNTKVIIAGVAILAALGIFILVGTGEESIPDTDDTRTPWICHACTHSFELTAAGYESSDKSENGVFVKCAKCSEVKAVRAATCAICQTVFATVNPEGKDGTCPKCAVVVVNAQQAPEAPTPEAEAAPVEEEAPAQRPVIFSE